MRLKFNEDEFRASALECFDSPDSTPATVSPGRLDDDDHAQIVGAYTDVVNHHESGALFTTDDAQVSSVTLWIETAFDGEGIFDGVLFDAWLTVQTHGGTEHLRITTSPEWLRIDDPATTSSPTFIDYLVGFVHDGVAMVNQQIAHDERVWSTVLGAA